MIAAELAALPCPLPTFQGHSAVFALIEARERSVHALKGYLAPEPRVPLPAGNSTAF